MDPIAYRSPILTGAEALSPAWRRYDLIRRITLCARPRQVQLLAFGLGPTELRVVLSGPQKACEATVRALRSGTARAAADWDEPFLWDDLDRIDTVDAAGAVAWAHAAAGPEPLRSPWSSHRDLLGVRFADFFDAGPAQTLVDPEDVHRRLSQVAPPRPQALQAPPRDLALLLAAASAVRGVLPGDRRAFRLFAHLAKRLGHHADAVANALRLTPRRVRQILRDDEPLVDVALLHLADDRLRPAA